MNAHLAKWIMYHEVRREGYSISKINSLTGCNLDALKVVF